MEKGPLEKERREDVRQFRAQAEGAGARGSLMHGGVEMHRSNKGADTNAIQIFFDASLCACMFLVSLLLTTDLRSIVHWAKMNLFALFLFEVLYILANMAMQVYNKTTFYYPDRIFKYNTWAFLLAGFVLLFLQNMAEEAAISNRFVLTFLLSSYVALILGTQVFHKVGQRLTGKYTTRLLMIGTEKTYEKYLYYINKTNMQIKVVGFLTEEEMLAGTDAERTERFEQYLRAHAVDEVCFMEEEREKFADAINLCIGMGITVELVIDHAWAEKSNCYVSAVGTYPVVVYHTISLNEGEQIVKRALDIVGSIVGTIVFSPIMLAAAIAVKLDSPGPVLFTQTRVGMNGRHFKIYKFRTMYTDAEARKQALMKQNEMSDARMFKVKDDPRITRVGRFLRKTSIDELPQLFNVLINDMSLVGTRPPTPDEVAQYDTSHWRRISIKPGITGMWQVSGRSEITNFDDVVQLDVSYIDGWNLFRDVKIIFQTVYCVLRKRGAC